MAIEISLVFIQVTVAWFLADFITGVFHWFEDLYLGENMTLEFLQSIAIDNRHHHTCPTALCLGSWWSNMRSATLAAVPVAFVAWLCGAPLWLWLGFGFCSFGNLIHRFAHEPPRRIGRVLHFMQWTGIFISPNHHRRHHYNPTTRKRVDPKWLSMGGYCPMTNWVNPVLDGLRFWVALEWALAKCGLHRVRTEERSAS